MPDSHIFVAKQSPKKKKIERKFEKIWKGTKCHERESMEEMK